LGNFGAVSLTNALQVSYVSADYLATRHNLLLHSIQRLPLPQACWRVLGAVFPNDATEAGIRKFRNNQARQFNRMNLGQTKACVTGQKQDGMLHCFRNVCGRGWSRFARRRRIIPQSHFRPRCSICNVENHIQLADWVLAVVLAGVTGISVCDARAAVILRDCMIELHQSGADHRPAEVMSTKEAP
jgi:hypothetical protein